MITKANATRPGTASLGIDIGGTFTDVVHLDHATGRQHALKVLTTHTDPSEAVIAGTRYCRPQPAAGSGAWCTPPRCSPTR